MVAKGYIFAFLYCALCILIALVASKLGARKKYTRKIVHILVGFEWFILQFYHGASYHFIIVCLIFVALLYIAYKFNLLPAMSSDSDNAPGTVFYGVSMTIMAVITYLIPEFIYPFGIAVVCTSVGDGFAGVVGGAVQKYNPKVYKNKTLFGALSNLVFSFIFTLLFVELFELHLAVWQILLISVFSAGLELISERGFDNITIPLGTSILAYSFMYIEGIVNYIVPIILTPFVILIVNRKKVLTPSGILFAVLLDIVVSVALGNFGFVLLLLFLALSVVIDKLKKIKTHGIDDISKRGDRRDEVQVIANGIVPAVMALCFVITGKPIFIVGYTATLAEAFADTAASGFGAFSNSAYDIFRFKKVAKGLSGGVSLIGTLSSLIAAIAFPFIAMAFGVLNLKFVFVSGFCAFAGAVFDSFLGSLCQAKYECERCGVVTEREVHCECKTKRISGLKVLDNDLVNVLSAVFAGVLAIIISALLI